MSKRGLEVRRLLFTCECSQTFAGTRHVHFLVDVHSLAGNLARTFLSLETGQVRLQTGHIRIFLGSFTSTRQCLYLTPPSQRALPSYPRPGSHVLNKAHTDPHIRRRTLLDHEPSRLRAYPSQVRILVPVFY